MGRRDEYTLTSYSPCQMSVVRGDFVYWTVGGVDR